MQYSRVLALLSGLTCTANALTVDANNADSIKSTAKTISNTIVNLYQANPPGSPVGIFQLPYYWWSAGATWDALIDYWFLTGDSSNNNLVSTALQAQLGPNNDYMPQNQTKSEGNSDQAFWASAALTAAERQFPSPPTTSSPSWLQQSINVFNEQVARWDTSSCAGGLRWQIFSFNSGYSYKNAESNAQFFQLAARLAKMTGNSTYSDWATKSYDWLSSVGLITSRGVVYDGTDSSTNCSVINRLQWSYNAGFVLYGSAVMYNLTSSALWKDRTSTVLNTTSQIFFKNGVMYEAACEGSGTCSIDQTFNKGLLARDMGRTAKIAPFTAGVIEPLLKSSAVAAAETCTGNNNTCALRWDGNGTRTGGGSSLGYQFSVLEVVQSNLVLGSGQLATGNSSASSAGGNGTSGGRPGGSGTTSGASSMTMALGSWTCLALAMFFTL